MVLSITALADSFRRKSTLLAVVRIETGHLHLCRRGFQSASASAARYGNRAYAGIASMWRLGRRRLQRVVPLPGHHVCRGCLTTRSGRRAASGVGAHGRAAGDDKHRPYDIQPLIAVCCGRGEPCVRPMKHTSVPTPCVANRAPRPGGRTRPRRRGARQTAHRFAQA